MLTQCKLLGNIQIAGNTIMNYQWAILAVFITFALLEAKNGRLFKKASEVSDDGGRTKQNKRLGYHKQKQRTDKLYLPIITDFAGLFK